MSYGDTFGDAPSSEDCIKKINVIENGYVVSKEYCPHCGCMDIKISKRGNKYCGNLCWTK